MKHYRAVPVWEYVVAFISLWTSYTLTIQSLCIITELLNINVAHTMCIRTPKTEETRNCQKYFGQLRHKILNLDFGTLWLAHSVAQNICCDLARFLPLMQHNANLHHSSCQCHVPCQVMWHRIMCSWLDLYAMWWLFVVRLTQPTVCPITNSLNHSQF